MVGEACQKLARDAARDLNHVSEQPVPDHQSASGWADGEKLVMLLPKDSR